MTLLKGRTFIVLIVLLIFFSITADNFMNMNTVLLIGKHVALYGILAIGMTYVIITGGIDLSVGAIVGLGGMIAGGLLQNGLTLKMFGVTLYFSVPMVVLITLLIGALIGVINGLIITKFNVAPFIATLGMMYVARGIANIHSNGATYSDLKGYEGLGNQGWGFFGSNVAGIPVGLLILIVLAVFFALLLKRTAFGWHVFSIGGNEKAAGTMAAAEFGTRAYKVKQEEKLNETMKFNVKKMQNQTYDVYRCFRIDYKALLNENIDSKIIQKEREINLLKKRLNNIKIDKFVKKEREYNHLQLLIQNKEICLDFLRRKKEKQEKRKRSVHLTFSWDYSRKWCSCN